MKTEQISDSMSMTDITEGLQDLLKVNGVYFTSAKDGRKIKIAIAQLVRLML